MFGYVKCYARVVCKKDDVSSIDHVKIHGNFENDFTREHFEKYANQIISNFINKAGRVLIYIRVRRKSMRLVLKKKPISLVT